MALAIRWSRPGVGRPVSEGKSVGKLTGIAGLIACAAPSAAVWAEMMVCSHCGPKAFISLAARNSLPPASKLEWRCRILSFGALI